MELIRIKWEYKVIANIEEDGMNLLGKEGWELINVMPAITRDGWVCIFKRMVENNDDDVELRADLLMKYGTTQTSRPVF